MKVYVCSEEHQKEVVTELFAVAYRTLGRILGDSNSLYNLAAPLFELAKASAEKHFAEGIRQSDLMFFFAKCEAERQFKLESGFLNIGFYKVFVLNADTYEKMMKYFIEDKSSIFDLHVQQIIATAVFFGLLAAKEGKSWQNYISDMEQWAVPKH